MDKLFVEVSDEGLIRIWPGTGTSSNSWRRAVSWWSIGDYSAVNSLQLRVEPMEFFHKMEWLREVWRGEVEVDPKVIVLVRNFSQGVEEFEKLRLGNPDTVPAGFQGPSAMARGLTVSQEKNVRYLLSMRNGANFSVPGAGKTMTALVVWQVLRQRAEVDKLLVVCPKSAFESWVSEVAETFSFNIPVHLFSGEPIPPEADVVLTNYEQIESVARLGYLKSWASRRSVHLVLDEAHRVKGGGRSVRWRACRTLSLVSKRVDLLTGTPMPQGVSDLAAIFRLAWPSLPSSVLNDRNLSSMRRNTTFVRTTKSELNLPPMPTRVVAGETSPLQAEIYSALRDQYAGAFGLTNRESALIAQRGKAVMSLIAAATNPGLLRASNFRDLALGIQWPPREVSSNHRLVSLLDQYMTYEMPWKFKFVAKKLEELANQGRKVIVWSSFVGNLIALKRVLAQFSPALVYGGTSGEDRASEIRRFRNSADCGVLLSNPQTLGEGISLHKECHEAIYVDRTYNAGLYLQSLDRIHRLGLEKDVLTNVTILETDSTIDKRIGARLELKIRKMAAFLDDGGLVKSSIPQVDEIRSDEMVGLDDEDLNDLLGHLGSEAG